MLQVSVIVPTYNRVDVVLRTLDTLFRQDFPPEQFEIVVVSDGSTDGSVERLRSLRPSCSFRIIEQENRGLAGARNSGLYAAGAPLVLFLDDDMFCAPALVSAHVAAQTQNRGTVGIGAFFLSSDSVGNLASDCFLKELGAFHVAHQQSPGLPLQTADYVFGNTSAPRELLLQAGGFDERFRMREDAELAFRLRKGGVEFRYVPDAVAYEHYTKSPKELVEDALRFAAADALFLEKHPEFYPASALARIARQPAWRRVARRVLRRVPGMLTHILPFCWSVLGRFRHWPFFRRMGVLVLQVHRSLVWSEHMSSVCKASDWNYHLNQSSGNGVDRLSSTEW